MAINCRHSWPLVIDLEEEIREKEGGSVHEKSLSGQVVKWLITRKSWVYLRRSTSSPGTGERLKYNR